jgi:hypothetical protein
MRTTIAAVLLSFPLFHAGFVCAASPDMQPGMWEITTKTEMPGIPVAIPPQTMRHCYTRKDVDDGALPKGKDAQNCKVKDYALKGNTGSWTVECTGENAMTGAGTMTYASNSYSGSMKSKIKQGGQIMEMTQSWSGKRVGDCK